MIPMRTSSVFKNRWMALVWAAGILWAAYDFADRQPGAVDSNSADANAEAPTDATGAPITNENEKQLEDAINGF